MNVKRIISLALTAAMLGTSVSAFADGKEEVIYGVLNGQGQVDGQQIDVDDLAGRSGHVEIELSIRQNPDCPGDLFRSHALQITASLDTEKCRNITAEGATQANVGTSRQLSFIVLPNMKKTC